MGLRSICHRPPPNIDWKSNAPWWIADYLPNMASELGLVLVCIGMISFYWPRSIKNSRDRKSASKVSGDAFIRRSYEFREIICALLIRVVATFALRDKTAGGFATHRGSRAIRTNFGFARDEFHGPTWSALPAAASSCIRATICCSAVL